MSKQKSAESKSGSAQAWAQPYATAGAGAVQGVFNQNQPALQQMTDQTHSQIFNPAVSNFQQSQGPANQASGYNSDVLSGKYLNGNPYMGNVINTLNRGVSDNVNSQFEANGRYGSGAQADVLSRNLASADGGIMYQNYGDEMNRMGQAAQGAQGAYQGNAGVAMQSAGQTAALPYTGSSALAGSLGALFGGGTQVQYKDNPIWGAVGAGLQTAGAVFSDRRLKTNITKVGEFKDGLGIYSFAYKKAPDQMFRGVMADEVKVLRPQAYVPNWNGSGYDAVNYGAL